MALERELDFTGKSVLVVGASRGGIGSAIARAFQEHGAEVVITGIEAGPTDVDSARFAYRQLDVRNDATVAALAHEYKRLDVLISAAGISQPDFEGRIEIFQEVLDVNLTGTFRVCQAFFPALKAARGAVVNISSTYSRFGSPRTQSYGASKAGVAQLTQSLALAWARDGVRVNALAPGFVVTEQSAPGRADPAHYQAVLLRTPMARWGEPEDLAGPTLFLASSLARFVTGVVLPVDGGYSAV